MVRSRSKPFSVGWHGIWYARCAVPLPAFVQTKRNDNRTTETETVWPIDADRFVWRSCRLRHFRSTTIVVRLTFVTFTYATFVLYVKRFFFSLRRSTFYVFECVSVCALRPYLTHEKNEWKPHNNRFVIHVLFVLLGSNANK